jgi:BirA family biotin operon repressor/biotin-[acetyl-CoA-carboxylase] ligase
MLLAQILNNVEADLLSWQGGKDLASKYRELSATIGREVRVELPDGSKIEGTAVDIDETGSLHLDSGQRITVGDVVHLDSKLSQ